MEYSKFINNYKKLKRRQELDASHLGWTAVASSEIMDILQPLSKATAKAAAVKKAKGIRKALGAQDSITRKDIKEIFLA